MLLDEKADQWNSTENSETHPNPNKKFVYKAAYHISRQKTRFSKCHQGNWVAIGFMLMWGHMYVWIIIKPKQTPGALYIHI